MKNITVFGIDPGFTGAISVFTDGEPHSVYDMPILKVGKKTELDESQIAYLFRSWIGTNCPYQAYIEKAQAMPGQGIVSTGRYLTGYGQILGILAGLQIPKTLVHPRTWKAKLMRDMGKEKMASVLRCKQMFPEFAQKNLTLKKHHGRADAILIAAYGIGL